MSALFRIVKLIDALNDRFASVAQWAVLACCLISAGNALVRYGLDYSSNAWLEIQWYLFSAIFLLCAGYTLLLNEHVRIDVISGHLSKRAQTWIDIIGTVLFLLPMAIIISWLSWRFFQEAVDRDEISGNAGGLVRWPVKLLIPIGFGLLALQGVSELIKRIAFLCGRIPDPTANTPGPHADPVAGEPV